MTMRMILKETSQNSRRWSEFQNFIIPERLRGAGKMASAWEVWKAKAKRGLGLIPYFFPRSFYLLGTNAVRGCTFFAWCFFF